jgi:hypothetical protein
MKFWIMYKRTDVEETGVYTNVQRTDTMQHQIGMSRISMVMEFISRLILLETNFCWGNI